MRQEKNHEVCAECLEFPCTKFKSAEDYQQLKESSSYPSYKKILPNLNLIKEHGIEKFIIQQNKRMKILETMIADFDDGISKSFFCKAATMLNINNLNNSIEKAVLKIKTSHIHQKDIKSKAKILKEYLNEIASKIEG